MDDDLVKDKRVNLEQRKQRDQKELAEAARRQREQALVQAAQDKQKADKLLKLGIDVCGGGCSSGGIAVSSSALTQRYAIDTCTEHEGIEARAVKRRRATEAAAGWHQEGCTHCCLVSAAAYCYCHSYCYSHTLHLTLLR